MSWEEVAALAILAATLCIIAGLGIWAAIRIEDKPKNGGLDTEFKPGDDSLMMLAKLAAKTDTDGCLDQRIIDYINIGKLDIE